MENRYKKIALPLRVLLIFAAGIIFAININSFVNSAELYPGGFSGLALLLQRFFLEKFQIKLPYSLLTYIFNLFPVYIGFRYIGKKFTLLSLLLIVVSGLFTDLFASIFPDFFVTDDRILCSVFGGILNAVAVALCLFAESSSGGTDFIAIYIADKTGKSAWNLIFGLNCVILFIAGLLFGWNSALYSVVFQFASTQALNFIYKKYAKTTLLIITDHHEEVYAVIKDLTNHDATVFYGRGKYSGKEKKMLYSVVSSSESGQLEKEIRKVDPDAFINVMQSKEIIGKFFRRAAD